jgi:hypothetical protein
MWVGVVHRRDVELKKQLMPLKNKELRFVMGTIRRHPNRWLLISIHAIEKHFNNRKNEINTTK